MKPAARAAERKKTIEAIKEEKKATQAKKRTEKVILKLM